LSADVRTSNKGFEGPAGRVAAAVMARVNRDMELAAADELALDGGAEVLAVGFGPGVGIASLLERGPEVRVCGVDPSATMVEQAGRRNRAAVRDGRLELVQAGAEDLPWGDDTFDAAVAVNSMQLWHPLEEAVREISRVLRPDGALVALTHTWAVEKTMTVEEWTAVTGGLLERYGFTGVTTRTGTFRSGPGLVQQAALSPVPSESRRVM
jgi:ubiquinone/menaquinone biosynthesis C-methylase UbiE